MGSPYSFWPTCSVAAGSTCSWTILNAFTYSAESSLHLSRGSAPGKYVRCWLSCFGGAHLALQIFQAQALQPSQITGSSCRPFLNFAKSVFWRVICPGPGSRSSSRQPPCFYPLSSAGSMNAGAGRRSTVLRALPLSSRWSCSPQAVSARNIFTLWPRGVIDGVDRLCAFLLLCVPLARAFSASSTIPLLSCSLVDEGWYQRLVTYMFLP